MLSEADIASLLARPADALDELDRIESEESLLEFTRRHWSILEPGRKMAQGWALEAMCEHLQAVTEGHIQKLLVNVPPGCMNSLLTDVFWPAWEWGPRYMPHLRYVAFSYSSLLTERDNRRFRDVMLSHDYGRLFGNSFSLTKAADYLVANDRTGWKLATSVGGVGTGERGDRVILDDPHNVKESESDNVRQETIRWFREGMSNRLNDADKSAVVIIMQRVHEEDVSGVILSELRHDYEHLLIPMEWEGQRLISTVPAMPKLNTEDPRTKVGELAWPDRFSPPAVRNLKTTVGPYAWEGQYQQRPSPRGGGIFKRDWWVTWESPNGRFPVFEYVLASLDGAYTEKAENDYTALTMWGIFREQMTVPSGASLERRALAQQGRPKIMLIHAWQKRLPIVGVQQPPRGEEESEREWFSRVSPHWGVVEWTAYTCRRFRANLLLVESKASGISVAQTIRAQHHNEHFGVKLVDPGRADKIARAYAVQPLFADQMIYAPWPADSTEPYEWVEMVISQMATFPKSTHNDLTDTATQALRFLREQGLAMHGHEIEAELAQAMRHPAQRSSAPLYPGTTR